MRSWLVFVYFGMKTLVSAAHADTPPNDHFDNRKILGAVISFTVSGNYTGSTLDLSQFPANHGSLWWSWTAEQSGIFRVRATEPNTATALFSGTRLSDLKLLNYDRNQFYDVVAGETYFIRLLGKIHGDPELNTFRIEGRLYNETPKNDDFADRQDLGDETVSFRGHTVFATVERGEPNPSRLGRSIASVWYEWRAPSDGLTSVAVTGVDSEMLQIYAGGASLSALQPVSQLRNPSPGALMTFLSLSLIHI